MITSAKKTRLTILQRLILIALVGIIITIVTAY